MEFLILKNGNENQAGVKSEKVDSSLVQKGISPNSVIVRDRVRVSDKVKKKDKLHLWL